MQILIIVPISGIISILAALYLFFNLLKQEKGTERMIEIADAIREGSNAYLKRQNKTLAIFVLIMAILLWILLDFLE
ncbi:unnamed protein product [marine sediment metagenome]|uniref:Uncharacterized protein n=1 Tax=marine sediment metagenome TaxID=412755 RepID=X0Z306_9ZZZZ